jgi:5-methylcytosine-specific restriction endonuclease McrA
MSGVLVLNAGYEPMHRVSIRHAIGMLVREVAVVEEAVEGRSVGPFPMPRVLRLVRYVALKWRHRTPSWSRARLLERDGGVCGYCGGVGDTVDHVVPVCRGGGSGWLNTVAACRKCNHRKGSRTVAAAGMTLRVTPWVPTWWQVSIAR